MLTFGPARTVVTTAIAGPMSKYELPIGEAENTFFGKRTAIKAFNFHQRSLNCPQCEELTNKDVESDNLQHIIGRFALWLAKTAIPTYHDENFELRVSTTGQATEYLEVSTKIKYFERMKEVLKVKFSTHPYWKE